MTDLEVKPEVFSMINAIFTLIAGIATTFQDKIYKKFRNKTFAFLSLTFTISVIMTGILLLTGKNNILPIILILLSIRNITMSNYYVLAERYSKNFSTAKTRSRISFATEFTTNIIEAIAVFLAGMLLDATNIRFATIFIGLAFLVLFVLGLDYMRTRVGLKPKEYDKKDIELE